MNEEELPKPPSRAFKWTLICVIAFVFLFLALPILASRPWTIQFIYHLVAGWIMHAGRGLSHLMANFPQFGKAAVLPVLAAFVAIWGFHRLVLWWRRANGKDSGWRFQHTALAGALVLLGSAAAIALSGVLHEAAWLPQGKIIRSNRGMTQTMAVSNARQLGLALFEFENEHGKYPRSVMELEEFLERESLRRMIFAEVDPGIPLEPVILLRPGASASGDPGRILLVSPLMPEEDVFIALRMDNSVTRLNAAQFAEVVKSAANEKHEGK